jgi:fatty aldehyde decarbonylase
MLNEVAEDADILGMEKEALIEDFMIQYSEALENIGFNKRELVRLSMHGLAAA